MPNVEHRKFASQLDFAFSFSQDMIRNRENVSIFIIYFLEKLLLIFKTATTRDWSENFKLVHVNVCVLQLYM